MNDNWVRQKVISGETTIGGFLGLGSPNVAELLGHVGLEWLVIETEHSGLDSSQVEHMLMAIKGTNTIPIVRVPPFDLFSIQRSLDLGAMGVLVPMIKTAAEAEAVVSATRYPPKGTRGFGPLRASKYTIEYDSYLENANKNILVALILETKEAVENLEEIASIPGIDIIYMGLWDLSLSMGLDPRLQPLPETDTVIETALKVSQKTGVAIGTGCEDFEELLRRESEGFTFMGYGSDYSLLLNAASTRVKAFQASRSPKRES